MTLIANNTSNSLDNNSIIWTSSDDTIATVSNGVVIALKDGIVTITATSENGMSTSTTIQIISSSLAVTSVVFDQTIVQMNIEDTFTIHASLTPSDTPIKTLTWESSSPSVATVDDSGIVTALEVGTTTITATSINGKVAHCLVRVVDPKLVPTKLTLNTTSKEMNVGDYFSLIAEIEPIGVVNQSI